MQRLTMKKFLDTSIAIIMVTLAIAALLGSIYLIYTPTPVITMITHNGTTYKCKHYPNEMECHDIDDPDVGFGRLENP